MRQVQLRARPAQGRDRGCDLTAVVGAVVEDMAQRGGKRQHHGLAVAARVGQRAQQPLVCPGRDQRRPGHRALQQTLTQPVAVGFGFDIQRHDRRHALGKARKPHQVFTDQQMVERAVDALEEQARVASVVGFGQCIDMRKQALRGPPVVAGQRLQMLAQRRAIQVLLHDHAAIGPARPLHLAHVGMAHAAVQRAQAVGRQRGVQRHAAIAVLACPGFAGQDQLAADTAALHGRVHAELVEVRGIGIAKPGHIGCPGSAVDVVGAADSDGADHGAGQLGHEALAFGGTAACGLGVLGGGVEVQTLRGQRGVGAVQQRGQRIERVACGQRADGDGSVHQCLQPRSPRSCSKAWKSRSRCSSA